MRKLRKGGTHANRRFTLAAKLPDAGISLKQSRKMSGRKRPLTGLSENRCEKLGQARVRRTSQTGPGEVRPSEKTMSAVFIN